jgi:hypothetical protein
MNVKEKIGRFRKHTENEFRGGFEFFPGFSGTPHGDPPRRLSAILWAIDILRQKELSCERTTFTP